MSAKAHPVERDCRWKEKDARGAVVAATASTKSDREGIGRRAVRRDKEKPIPRGVTGDEGCRSKRNDDSWKERAKPSPYLASWRE